MPDNELEGEVMKSSSPITKPDWLDRLLELEDLKEEFIDNIGPVLAGAFEEFAMDWTEQYDPIKQAAEKFAQERAAELVTGIDDTTRQNLRDEFARRFEAGDRAEDVRDALKQYHDDISDYRAIMIGRTEGNIASNTGKLSGFQQAGIQTKMWVTANDERVGDDHEPLHRETAAINEPFSNGVMAPPDRPNCRCVIHGVVEEAQ